VSLLLPKPTRIVISCDPELKRGTAKCGVLHFSGINLRNGAGYALDQYRTLIGNRIRRVEWCEHLRLSEVPENALGTHSNSAVGVASMQRLACDAISAVAELLVHLLAYLTFINWHLPDF